MKVKRIAIVLISTGIGGTERRIANLTQYLSADRTTEVVLILNDELADALERVGMKIGCQRITLRSWFRYAPDADCGSVFSMIARKFAAVTNHLWLSLQLGLVLRRVKPDVLQLILDSARLIFTPFIFFNRAALVVSLVGEIRELRSMKAFDRWVLARSVGKAALVDALSEELRDAAINFGVAPAAKIRVQGSFVEADALVPAQEKSPWVVFAGRLIADKNPMMFVDAIPAIVETLGPHVRFFVLGTGPLERAVRARVREIGLDGSTFVGFVPDISDVLEKSMVFCSLQGKENYPSRSLLEAMACGNAIVATDVGWTYKLVNDQTGLRVPAAAGAVATAVVELMRDPQRALRFGRNARELVCREYSPAGYCDRLLQVYDEAMALRASAQ